MKTPRERWLERIEKRVPGLEEEAARKEETKAIGAALSKLTMATLKWVNNQFRRCPELDDDAVTLAQMWREAARLSDLDRQGLLTGYWWQEYQPDWSRPATE